MKLRAHTADIEVPETADEKDAFVSTEIKMAINTLPEKIRITIVMFYVEQFSIKEIKLILHIPEGTVKSRLEKGRKLLKIEMDV